MAPITTTTAGAVIRGAGDPLTSRGKMKVKTTRNTIVVGHGHVGAGSEIEVDDKTAKALFTFGKALPLPEGPKKPTTRKPKPAARKKK